MWSRNKGQVLLEYGVVLVLVLTALISMQLYIQRSLQARAKEATDKAVREIHQAKGTSALPTQYEPYYQESDILATSSSKIVSSYSPEGKTSEVIDYDRTERTGRRYELPYSDGRGD